MTRPYVALPLLALALACAEPATSPDQGGAPAPQLTVAATTGTWQLYPPQASLYATAVQQPINADGSSNFKSNGKAVIPVKFALSAGTGPAVFESIGSDAGTDNDYSFVSFTPTSLTFADVTTLSSVYAFTLGDCHGGALRWQVRTSSTEALFIYYGAPPQFGNGGVGGCTPASSGGLDQSGANLVALSDLRYDTSQYPGGTFYDTYAHALTLMGTLPIVRVSLVLDGGWGGDQRLTLTSATVNDNTFTPAAATSPAPTCELPAATVKITKTDGTPTGDVNEPISIQPADDNLSFRTVDCKYVYNLATSSLSGVGSYSIYAVIGGSPASGPAKFDLK